MQQVTIICIYNNQMQQEKWTYRVKQIIITTVTSFTISAKTKTTVVSFLRFTITTTTTYGFCLSNKFTRLFQKWTTEIVVKSLYHLDTLPLCNQQRQSTKKKCYFVTVRNLQKWYGTWALWCCWLGKGKGIRPLKSSCNCPERFSFSKASLTRNNSGRRGWLNKNRR